ncbi:hypothetical protein [Mucilaginibacter mali]|nr:hypothetical protein [Mucilaginibacter mali]
MTFIAVGFSQRNTVNKLALAELHYVLAKASFFGSNPSHKWDGNE